MRRTALGYAVRFAELFIGVADETRGIVQPNVPFVLRSSNDMMTSQTPWMLDRCIPM